MASCNSVSSNISSSINTINIAQGSGGSRLLVTIPFVSGLTSGTVIRYDVASSGWTGSRANNAENAEVFGVIESFNSLTQKFNVVMSGSIYIDPNNLVNLPEDPTGACGGNDIYFLSDTSAGVLQNLAPSDLSHIIKPVYQRGPHGTYTGSVVNYTGYRMGGDVQGSLDTANVLARVGCIQLILQDENTDSVYDTEAIVFKNTNSYDLNATTPTNWNFEFIKVSNLPDELPPFRYIDFPELSQKVFPRINDGWIERLKVDTTYTFDTNLLGKAFQQPVHANYSTATPQDSCYGQLVYWDSTNRYLYIRRPAFWNNNLSNSDFLNSRLVEINSSGLNVYNSTQGPEGDVLATIPITSTDTTIQFFGYLMPSVRLANVIGGGLDYPFQIQTSFDPYNQNIPELIGTNVDVYMKVKNKGISVVVPNTFTVNEITASAVTAGSLNVEQKLLELETRLDNAGVP